MKTMVRTGWFLVLALAIAIAGQVRPARAADGDAAPDAKEVQDVLKKSVAFLKKQQKEDGSWLNPGDKKFGENDPTLATAFAVLTLSYCKAKK